MSIICRICETNLGCDVCISCGLCKKCKSIEAEFDDLFYNENKVKFIPRRAIITEDIMCKVSNTADWQFIQFKEIAICAL